MALVLSYAVVFAPLFVLSGASGNPLGIPASSSDVTTEASPETSVPVDRLVGDMLASDPDRLASSFEQYQGMLSELRARVFGDTEPATWLYAVNSDDLATSTLRVDTHLGEPCLFFIDHRQTDEDAESLVLAESLILEYIDIVKGELVASAGTGDLVPLTAALAVYTTVGEDGMLRIVAHLVPIRIDSQDIMVDGPGGGWIAGDAGDLLASNASDVDSRVDR